MKVSYKNKILIIFVMIMIFSTIFGRIVLGQEATVFEVDGKTEQVEEIMVGEEVLTEDSEVEDTATPSNLDDTTSEGNQSNSLQEEPVSEVVKEYVEEDNYTLYVDEEAKDTDTTKVDIPVTVQGVTIEEEVIPLPDTNLLLKKEVQNTEKTVAINATTKSGKVIFKNIPNGKYILYSKKRFKDAEEIPLKDIEVADGQLKTSGLDRIMVFAAPYNKNLEVYNYDSQTRNKITQGGAQFEINGDYRTTNNKGEAYWQNYSNRQYLWQTRPAAGYKINPQRNYGEYIGEVYFDGAFPTNPISNRDLSNYFYNKSSWISQNEVYPLQYQSIEVITEAKIDDYQNVDIKPGDYFEIRMDYRTNSGSEISRNQERAYRAFANGAVVAEGRELNNNWIRFTFNDFVKLSDISNIKIKTRRYIDRFEVKNSQRVQIQDYFGGNIYTSNNVYVNYNHYASENNYTNQGIHITKYQNGEYEALIYLNPLARTGQSYYGNPGFRFEVAGSGYQGFQIDFAYMNNGAHNNLSDINAFPSQISMPPSYGIHYDNLNYKNTNPYKTPAGNWGKNPAVCYGRQTNPKLTNDNWPRYINDIYFRCHFLNGRYGAFSNKAYNEAYGYIIRIKGRYNQNSSSPLILNSKIQNYHRDTWNPNPDTESTVTAQIAPDNYNETTDINNNHWIKVNVYNEPNSINFYMKERGYNTYIKNVHLELRKWDGAQYRSNQDAWSNGDGLVNFNRLAPGDYQLYETSTPKPFLHPKFNLDTSLLSFNVNQWGQISIGDTTIEHEYSRVWFETLTSDGLLLDKNIQINIWNDKESTWQDYSQTINGKVKFESLPPGNYTIYDSNVPNNYKSPGDPLGRIEITTTGDYRIIESKDNHLVQLTNGDIGIYYKKHNSITFRTLIWEQDNHATILPKVDLDIMKWDSQQGKFVLFDTVSTDSNGYVTLEDLEPGGYKIRENEAPYGLQLHDSEEDKMGDDYLRWVFLRDDGSYEILKGENNWPNIGPTPTPNEESLLNIYYKRLPTTKFKIKKIDEKGQPLKGAEFKLEVGDEDDPSIFTGITNDKGEYTFENIPKGNLQIQETKAPEGYVKEENMYHIPVGADYKIPDNPTNPRDVSNFMSIETFDTEDTVVDPIKAEIIDSTITIAIQRDGRMGDSKIRPGDYFKLYYDGPISLGGIIPEGSKYQFFNIMDAAGCVAKGQYFKDEKGKGYKITFTEYAKYFTLRKTLDIDSQLYIDLYQQTKPGKIDISARLGESNKDLHIRNTQHLVRGVNESEEMRQFKEKVVTQRLLQNTKVNLTKAVAGTKGSHLEEEAVAEVVTEEEVVEEEAELSDHANNEELAPEVDNLEERTTIAEDTDKRQPEESTNPLVVKELEITKEFDANIKQNNFNQQVRINEKPINPNGKDKIQVNYSSGTVSQDGVTIGSKIMVLDEINKNVQETIYINPQGANNENIHGLYELSISQTGEGLINKDAEFKIYKVQTPNKDSFPDSFGVDTTNTAIYQDVTSSFAIDKSRADNTSQGQITFDMVGKMTESCGYVIKATYHYGSPVENFDAGVETIHKGKFATYAQNANGYWYKKYGGWLSYSNYLKTFQVTSEAAGDLEITVVNHKELNPPTPKNNVQFLKVGQRGAFFEDLDDVEFRVEVQNGETWQPFTGSPCDENGKIVTVDGGFEFENLNIDTTEIVRYRIFETKTNPGYHLPNQEDHDGNPLPIIEFQVNPDDLRTITITKNTTQDADNQNSNIIQNIGEEPEYPATGGIGQFIYFVMGVLLIMTAHILYRKESLHQ
ncbi:Cna protein B-type domain-containing protein [Granulicatella balaenopterae]|uniref:Cna protein B-type domain-containing protein n=1 Tax=Granulicatella balaenopterae TaxID=137733 RepID=A0A1H9KES7_9LACT|nr:SpaA isopeptide-forming pilin-related protein [Granulicatella balaenopterae]SEQ97621.1 Cna protein B-type domain-containing protein [Granulicatella balaenopterae]